MSIGIEWFDVLKLFESHFFLLLKNFWSQSRPTNAFYLKDNNYITYLVSISLFRLVKLAKSVQSFQNSRTRKPKNTRQSDKRHFVLMSLFDWFFVAFLCNRILCALAERFQNEPPCRRRRLRRIIETCSNAFLVNYLQIQKQFWSGRFRHTR